MAQSDPSLPEWPFSRKVIFCFFFIFFVLYIFLNPNESIPHSYALHKFYIKPCADIVVWIARDVLHIVGPEIRFYSGITDTVYGYLTVLFIFCAAVYGSVIWAVIDRRRANYQTLYKVLIVILRYYLAVTFIAYGSFKLVRFQFPSFSPVMLLQAYGNTTPKELAWSFMGYSDRYNYFIGFGEYLAGFLLFFRRTSLLGAIIGLGLLANIVAFNYSYDVNVKLFTTVMLIMTLFIMIKDSRRLSDFFFFNKITLSSDDKSLTIKRQWLYKALRIGKYVFIVYVVFFNLRIDYAKTKSGHYNTMKQPLYGIYNVTIFVRNKDTLKPLTTDTFRWKKLVISSPPGSASVMLMNDSLKSFKITTDTVKKKILMYAQADISDSYTFTYSELKPNMLMISGTWHKDSLQIQFQKYDLKRFPLVNHSFRWIIDHSADINKKISPRF